MLAGISAMPNIWAFAEQSDYIYVLANFLKQPSYWEWLETIRFKGRGGIAAPYIIMDNGTYELGHPISDKKLIEYAEYFNPDVVIAPDYIGNKEQTLSAFRKFIKVWRKVTKKWTVTPQLMGVLQGVTFLELRDCLRAYRRFGISFFGLPIFIHRTLGRPQFWHWLRSELFIRSWEKFHLLGLDDLAELWCYKEQFEIVSVDSTLAPFYSPKVLTAFEPKIDLVEHNDKRILSDEEWKIAQKNVKEYMRVAHAVGSF